MPCLRCEIQGTLYLGYAALILPWQGNHRQMVAMLAHSHRNVGVQVVLQGACSPSDPRLSLVT
jgi:hypothetical protein